MFNWMTFGSLQEDTCDGGIMKNRKGSIIKMSELFFQFSKAYYHVTDF